MANRVMHTAHVVLRMERMSPLMESELERELSISAQMVERRQRALAPKFRSLLVETISVQRAAPLERDIGPAAAYAAPQEEGVRPGGKGLPRFSDPEAADIKAWLQTQAFKGRSKPRANTMAAVRADLELRDRYEGLAWHIRHKGVKPTPHVLPALQQLEKEIQQRMQAAAQRAIERGGMA